MAPSGLIEKAFILKKAPLFEGIDLDLLLSLADKATLGHFDAEEIIFGAGQEGSRLYVVAEGRVGLWEEAARLIAKVEINDFFGDEALFNERPRGYSAAALENAVLLSLAKPHLMSFVNECPAVAINLMNIWASRIDCRCR